MTDTMSDALFAPDDPVETLLVLSYDGEVQAEVLFALMADQLDDAGADDSADHAYKLRVLSTLERCTKEAMVPTMARAGLPTDEEAKATVIQQGKDLAAALEGTPWLDLAASLEPITNQYLAVYERIGVLHPAEQETSALLVAHELALREFGRLEVAGRGDESLTAILALPHVHVAG